MSETPLAENKIINNDSGLLTNMQAYSPGLISPKEPYGRPQSSNQADSIQKILSTSIQRAKQKITMLEGRQKQERPESKERVNSKQGHNTAIAAAMKVLQSRVNQLQQIIENLERERAIIMKELDSHTNEKKIILSNLEESNKKITLLEQNLKSNKAELKELSKQLEDSQSQKNQLEAKCQTLEMSVRHLQTDKQQLMAQLTRKQQELAKKSSPPHKMPPINKPDPEDKQKLLQEKEKKLHEKQRRLFQLQASLKQKEIKLTSQKMNINEITEENGQLKRQVNNLKKSLAEQSMKEVQQKENYQVYLGKIKQMESELSMLRQTTKHLETQGNNQPNEQQLQNVREDLSLFQSKYEELLRLFKKNEEKSKRDEKQIKLQKDRTRQLEDLLSEITEKISKLPNCTKELKYLTVKAGKVMNSQLQRAMTLKTPTKSRSNSLNRSLSRSNSQRKNTQTSQLSNSRHSNKGPQSGSKSKKKQQSGSKSKRVVVSQTGWENTEKEVNQLKRQYKRLVKILDQTEDEETRNRVNELAFAIQQKNEKTTKMKQQHRNK